MCPFFGHTDLSVPSLLDFGRADPFLPGTVPFRMRRPLPAPFLAFFGPVPARFGRADPFLPGTVPFWDIWTLACPVFGRADPFLPRFVPFCPFLNIWTPFCPLFGHADHFLPNIVPFWTHEPLPAPFLDVPTISCPGT